jgi:ribose transport system substrate-binding protein
MHAFSSAMLASLLALAGVAAAGPAGAQAGLDRAKAALEPYRSSPRFVAPGEPFDARACAAGKKQLSIPNSSANPFLKGIIERERRIGAQLGLEVVEWENQGQPNQWVQGVDHAVRNKFQIVDLISGIDPKTIEPSVRAAKDAGVKVMTSHFYDPSQPQNPYVASSVTIGFNEVGRVLANWSIAHTDGKATIIVVQSDEVPPTAPLVQGIRDELAANCPDCRIAQQINVGVTEWATKIQPSVQAALLANPSANIVIPIYDSMSQFVMPALQLTGRASRVAVATFNGTPFVLDFVREGRVAMNVGESLDWIAHATIDHHLRALCGLPTPKALNVPFYIFDKSNVAQAGTPASYDKGYGDAYVKGFRQLWKLEN